MLSLNVAEEWGRSSDYTPLAELSWPSTWSRHELRKKGQSRLRAITDSRSRSRAKTDSRSRSRAETDSRSRSRLKADSRSRVKTDSRSRSQTKAGSRSQSPSGRGWDHKRRRVLLTPEPLSRSPSLPRTSSRTSVITVRSRSLESVYLIKEPSPQRAQSFDAMSQMHLLVPVATKLTAEDMRAYSISSSLKSHASKPKNKILKSKKHLKSLSPNKAKLRRHKEKSGAILRTPSLPSTPKALTPEPSTSKQSTPRSSLPEKSSRKKSNPNASTSKPSTPKPLTSNSSSPKPSTSNPSTPESSTPKPSTSNPLTRKPMTPKPSTSNLLTPKQSTPKPLTPKLLMPKPSTSNPSTPKQTTPKPTTPKPWTSNPSTAQPSTPSLSQQGPVGNSTVPQGTVWRRTANSVVVEGPWEILRMQKLPHINQEIPPNEPLNVVIPLSPTAAKAQTSKRPPTPVGLSSPTGPRLPLKKRPLLFVETFSPSRQMESNIPLKSALLMEAVPLETWTSSQEQGLPLAISPTGPCVLERPASLPTTAAYQRIQDQPLTVLPLPIDPWTPIPVPNLSNESSMHYDLLLFTSPRPAMECSMATRSPSPTDMQWHMSTCTQLRSPAEFSISSQPQSPIIVTQRRTPTKSPSWEREQMASPTESMKLLLASIPLPPDPDSDHNEAHSPVTSCYSSNSSDIKSPNLSETDEPNAKRTPMQSCTSSRSSRSSSKRTPTDCLSSSESDEPTTKRSPCYSLSSAQLYKSPRQTSIHSPFPTELEITKEEHKILSPCPMDTPSKTKIQFESISQFENTERSTIKLHSPLKQLTPTEINTPNISTSPSNQLANKDQTPSLLSKIQAWIDSTSAKSLSTKKNRTPIRSPSLMVQSASNSPWRVTKTPTPLQFPSSKGKNVHPTKDQTTIRSPSPMVQSALRSPWRQTKIPTPFHFSSPTGQYVDLTREQTPSTFSLNEQITMKRKTQIRGTSPTKLQCAIEDQTPNQQHSPIAQLSPLKICAKRQSASPIEQYIPSTIQTQIESASPTEPQLVKKDRTPNQSPSPAEQYVPSKIRSPIQSTSPTVWFAKKNRTPVRSPSPIVPFAPQTVKWSPTKTPRPLQSPPLVDNKDQILIRLTSPKNKNISTKTRTASKLLTQIESATPFKLHLAKKDQTITRSPSPKEFECPMEFLAAQEERTPMPSPAVDWSPEITPTPSRSPSPKILQSTDEKQTPIRSPLSEDKLKSTQSTCSTNEFAKYDQRQNLSPSPTEQRTSRKILTSQVHSSSKEELRQKTQTQRTPSHLTSPSGSSPEPETTFKKLLPADQVLWKKYKKSLKSQTWKEQRFRNEERISSESSSSAKKRSWKKDRPTFKVILPEGPVPWKPPKTNLAQRYQAKEPSSAEPLLQNRERTKISPSPTDQALPTNRPQIQSPTSLIQEQGRPLIRSPSPMEWILRKISPQSPSTMERQLMKKQPSIRSPSPWELRSSMKERKPIRSPSPRDPRLRAKQMPISPLNQTRANNKTPIRWSISPGQMSSDEFTTHAIWSNILTDPRKYTKNQTPKYVPLESRKLVQKRVYIRSPSMPRTKYASNAPSILKKSRDSRIEPKLLRSPTQKKSTLHHTPTVSPAPDPQHHTIDVPSARSSCLTDPWILSQIPLPPSTSAETQIRPKKQTPLRSTSPMTQWEPMEDRSNTGSSSPTDPWTSARKRYSPSPKIVLHIHTTVDPRILSQQSAKELLSPLKPWLPVDGRTTRPQSPPEPCVPTRDRLPDHPQDPRERKQHRRISPITRRSETSIADPWTPLPERPVRPRSPEASRLIGARNTSWSDLWASERRRRRTLRSPSPRPRQQHPRKSPLKPPPPRRNPRSLTASPPRSPPTWPNLHSGSSSPSMSPG